MVSLSLRERYIELAETVFMIPNPRSWPLSRLMPQGLSLRIARRSQAMTYSLLVAPAPQQSTLPLPRKPHSAFDCPNPISLLRLDVVLCDPCCISIPSVHCFASPTSSPQRLPKINNRYSPQAVQHSKDGILKCEQEAQGHGGRLGQLVRSSVCVLPRRC